MHDTTPALPSEPPAPQPAAMSLVARLVNVFVSPGEVFAEVKASPPSPANWLMPAVLVAGVSLLGAWLVFSQETINHQIGEMIDRQMEQAHAPKAQAEAGRSIGVFVTKIMFVAGPVIGAFIVPFWTGLVLWLVGAKVLKGDFGYMKAVEVGGLTNMITVLDALVKIPLIISMGNLFASPGLALLVKDFDPQKPVHGLLGMVNVMLLWALIVQSIGLARLSGRSIAVAAAWIFGISAVITGFFMGIGFAFRAAFSR